jgi:hypothetical protein
MGIFAVRISHPIHVGYRFGDYSHRGSAGLDVWQAGDAPTAPPKFFVTSEIMLD